MKTSSVSLKSILSTSGLVLSLISSSFKTSSGSSSKNIIFSISRRLRISFLKPNSNWNREGNFLLDLLLTCSWDSLQLWFWGGRLSHFWVGHTYNWLVDCQHTWDLPQRDRPPCFEQGRCWSGPGGSEKKIQEGSHILANYTKYTKHQHQHHLFYLELVVPMTVTLVWEGRSCSSSSLRATSCARPEKLDHFIQSLFTCSKRISSDKDVVVRMARQHIRDFGNGRPCQSLSTGSKTSVSNALKNESCLPGAGFGGQVFGKCLKDSLGGKRKSVLQGPSIYQAGLEWGKPGWQHISLVKGVNQACAPCCVLLKYLCPEQWENYPPVLVLKGDHMVWHVLINAPEKWLMQVRKNNKGIFLNSFLRKMPKCDFLAGL